jgi:hypothetical protein
MRSGRIVPIAIAALLAAGLLVTRDWTERVAAGPSPAAIDPNDFTEPVPNPYFPLTPGMVFRYRGSEDNQRFVERLAVTPATKVIQGVTTTVVRDILRRADGTLAEKTHDWYAADNNGNVWYFGEATATYRPDGSINSTEGSWEAGVKGAVAGTIMLANPKPTDAYRQEFYPGHAEDQAWTVQVNAHVRVPLRSFDRVVRSFEWTRLEPNVLSAKFYARGFGIVKEQDVAGGTELFELVAVTRP